MKKIFFAAVVAACLVAAPAVNRAAAHDAAHGAAHDNANHARRKSARRAPRRSAKARRKSPAQGATAVFTCPMHPDVRSKTAGACPKCGMEMEAKRPGVE